MSKKNKKVAKASLFAMMTEMWADVRSGKVDAMSINLTKYAEKYHNEGYDLDREKSTDRLLVFVKSEEVKGKFID